MNFFFKMFDYLLEGTLLEHEFYIAGYIIIVISTAIIYHKFNFKWWTAFIPVLSTMTLLKIAKFSRKWVLLIVLNYLLLLLPREQIHSLVVGEAAYIMYLRVFFITLEGGLLIWAYAKLGERYNKNVLTALLIFLIPFIVLPYLASIKPIQVDESIKHPVWTSFFK